MGRHRDNLRQRYNAAHDSTITFGARLDSGGLSLVVAVTASSEYASPTDLPGRIRRATIPNNWVLGEVTSIAVDRAITSGCCIGRGPFLPIVAPTPRHRCSSSMPPGSSSRAGAGTLPVMTGPNGSTASMSMPRDSSGSAGTAAGRSRPRPAARRHDPEVHSGRKLVMQIGRRGQSTGNADTANVHQPGMYSCTRQPMTVRG